jgi:hypothetical protein
MFGNKNRNLRGNFIVIERLGRWLGRFIFCIKYRGIKKPCILQADWLK